MLKSSLQRGMGLVKERRGKSRVAGTIGAPSSEGLKDHYNITVAYTTNITTWASRASI